MDRSRPSVPSWLVNALLTAVALGLLGLTVWMKWDQILEVFRGDHPINGRLLALAFAINVAGLVLTFVRWFFLVRALGLPFLLRDAVRLGFIGNVFNLVIPGAVGGDVIKAAFLCREQARKTQAIASMVIDRLVGLLGLFLLAGVSGIWAWPGAGPDVRRLIVVVGLAVAAGVVGLAILFTPSLYLPLERLFAGRGRLETLLAELVALASAYRRRLAVVIGAVVMAMGNHSLNVLSFYLVSTALFPSLPTLAQHFLLVPLTLFTTAVPLPFGALGLTEQVSDQLFKLVAHPNGAVAMMGYRVIMYAGGLLSVGVYLANLRQVRTLKAAGPHDHLDRRPEEEPRHADASAMVSR